MKFIFTKELGRLAKWTRILGFDAAYFKKEGFGSLIIEALRDERIIVTRNHRLPRHGGAKIIVLEAQEIKGQLQELLKTLNIKAPSSMMFTRCTVCNEELAGIDKEKIKDKVPEYVFKTQNNFIRCPKCSRIYWQGTHWGNVKKIFEEIK